MHIEARPVWQIRRWPDPDKGPFLLRLWFKKVNDRPVVVGVEFWGTTPEDEPWPDGVLVPDIAIRATDVRLPLGDLLDSWVAFARSMQIAARLLPQMPGGEQAPGHEERVAESERRFGFGGGRGRPRLPPTFLREVAEVYRRAISAGDRAPALAVKRELNANTDASARSWVYQARKRGYLGKDER